MWLEVTPLLSPQQLVRWNRGKIMLVGQGRTGKTALANNLTGVWIPDAPSTVGAEQFDVKMFYGGLNGGKLKSVDLPESQLEYFLAEPYFHEPLPSNSQSGLVSERRTRQRTAAT